MRYCNFLFICLFCFDNIVFSQEKHTVRGNIKDVDGEPVMQATIKEKNGRSMASSDMQGNYRIEVSDKNAILEFSFLGQKKEERINGRSTVDIVLDDKDQILEDMVVTGFQTISKERTSGSFEVMSKEILNTKPTSDVSSLLKGQMAGVDVSDEGSVTIRGISTFGSNRRPLVVVDGFPIEGGLESINQNNIESVNILKDAASASIWGARSANGVIVVTTKSAKTGDKEERMDVAFNSFVRIGERINLDYANPIADAKTQLGLEKYFANELYKFNPNGIYTPSTLSSVNSQVQRTQGAYLYAMLSNGYLIQKDVDKIISELENINYQDDVNKYLLRNPIYQQHNFSVRGNTQRNNYNFSLMYDDNKTNYIGSEANKIVVDFKNTFKYNEYVSFVVSAFTSIQDELNNGVSMSEIKKLASYDRLVNPDGSYNNHSADINYGMRNYMNTMPFPYDWNYNLIQEINNRDLKKNSIQLRLQGGINVKFLEDFTFSSKYQYERRRIKNMDYYGVGTYEVRSMINTVLEVSDDHSTISNVFYPKGGINKNISNTVTDAYNFRNQIDYTGKFLDIHQVNAILGMEVIENLNIIETKPWDFGVDPNLNTTIKLPNTNTQSPSYTGGLTSLFHTINSSYLYTKRRYFSSYFNGSYTYDNKYTLTFSVRVDASNIITDDPKYKYTPLWSVGGNWNIKKEDFLKDISEIDRLNLRGSYGLNAQAAVGSSNATTVLVNNGGIYNDFNQVGSISKHGNPELRWEINKNFNIGIDYSLYNSLIFGKIDFYNKNGEDLLYERSLPSLIGFGNSANVNYAGILNRGIEIQLGTTLPIYERISITSDINYSYNYNEIVRLDENTKLVSGTRGTQTYFKGGKLGDYYAFKFNGYYNGVPYVVKEDGTNHPMTSPIPANTNAREKILYNMGTTIAPHMWGWTNTINVYDFSCTFVIVGKFGHIFARPTYFSSASVEVQSNYNKDIVNYTDNQWAEDFPGLITAETMSQIQQRANYTSYLSSNVDNASFIRFNDIILGYNLTNIFKDNDLFKFIKRINVFGNIRNLGVIWVGNKWGMDPEYPLGSIKPQTMYTIGLKLDI